jgi:hypothetical protein
MKVEDRSEAAPARPAADKGRFQQALQQAARHKARPPTPPVQRPGAQGSNAPVARGGVRAGTARAYASAEHLGQVRQQLHGEAHRLKEERGESHQATQERTTRRLTELVAQELSRELRAELPPPSNPLPPAGERQPSPSAEALSGAGEPRAASGSLGAAPPQPATSPEARVQSTLELIERIELFVRSQRPGLSLRLGGALEATVEVERTGPREVALRVQGHRGPLPAGELARMRQALQARGLRLSTLHAS